MFESLIAVAVGAVAPTATTFVVLPPPPLLAVSDMLDESDVAPRVARATSVCAPFETPVGVHDVENVPAGVPTPSTVATTVTPSSTQDIDVRFTSVVAAETVTGVPFVMVAPFDGAVSVGTAGGALPLPPPLRAIATRS